MTCSQNAVPHSIVAILLDDGLAPAAASAAALLARPGIDRVHLVTLVASQAAAPGGQELLEAHAAAVRERGVHVELLVQVGASTAPRRAHSRAQGMVACGTLRVPSFCAAP